MPEPNVVAQEAQEYTEEDLESFMPATTDASYFEKAQDFKQLVKRLRVKYLGLKPVQEERNGAIITIYKRDPNRQVGISEEGMEANIRFLEARLGSHTVLANWDKERMLDIIRDDMRAWSQMMKQNDEEYAATGSTVVELRILLNDLLESSYSRAVDNLERKDMRPFTSELKKLIGLGESQQAVDNMKYPTSMVDKMRGDSNADKY